MKNLLFCLMYLSINMLNAQVTSVGLSLPGSVFSISGSPVTMSGTLAGSFINQTANTFFSAPNGSSGTPTFRAIVATDLPEASSTNKGIVNISTQTFAGLKTFNSGVGLAANQIIYYQGNSFIRTGGGFDQNVMVGENAGANEISTNNGSVGVGYNALNNIGNTGATTTSHNTAIGWHSLESVTGDKNTMAGSRAGQSITSGAQNTGFGWNVYYGGASAVITGDDNVALGGEAAIGLSSGSRNTFLGRLAGSAVTTGSDNIFIGYNVIGSSASNSLINVGNAWYGDITNQTLGIGVSSPAATLHLKAGTTSASSAPIKFTGGSLMTTTEAGVFEYDGYSFYSSPLSGSRGVIPSVSYTSNTSATSITSGTAAQSVFPSASDAITINASETYFFEAQYIISGMGATTRTISTLFGGTAAISVNYSATSWSGGASALATSQTNRNIAVNTATEINVTNSNAETTIQLKGVIRSTTGGTIIPQIQFSAAPSGTITGAINSYFLIYPAGSNTSASVGNWN